MKKYLFTLLLFTACASCKKNSEPATSMIVTTHDSTFTLAPVAVQRQSSGMIIISASGAGGSLEFTIGEYHGVGSYKIDGYAVISNYLTDNSLLFNSGGYAANASDGDITVTKDNGSIIGTFSATGSGMSVSGKFTAP